MDRACNIRQVLSLQGHRFGVNDKAAYERSYYPTLLVLLLDSIGKRDLAGDLTLADQADLIWMLERIVYKEPDPPPKGRRRVTMCVADGMNLKHWLPDYRADRRAVGRLISDAVRASLEKHLTRGKVPG